MRHLTNRTTLARPIAALLLMAFLNSCMHWSVQPLEPTRFNSNDPPHNVRVYLNNGVRLEVENPYIAGDSLIWLMPKRQGIPLAEIAQVEIRTIDGAATGVLVAVPATFLFLIVAFAASCEGGGCIY
jgi:hypothetical protein